MPDKRIGSRDAGKESEAAAVTIRDIESERIVAELKRLGTLLSSVESEITAVRGRLDRIEASLAP